MRQLPEVPTLPDAPRVHKQKARCAWCVVAGPVSTATASYRPYLGARCRAAVTVTAVGSASSSDLRPQSWPYKAREPLLPSLIYPPFLCLSHKWLLWRFYKAAPGTNLLQNFRDSREYQYLKTSEERDTASKFLRKVMAMGDVGPGSKFPRTKCEVEAPAPRHVMSN